MGEGSVLGTLHKVVLHLTGCLSVSSSGIIVVSASQT